ncbi:MAG: N-formylglutamate amidohydrolase [Aeromicrobium sp.]
MGSADGIASEWPHTVTDRLRSASPFSFTGDRHARVLATAIHAGHDVRPEVAEVLGLDDASRRREEDPHTDLLAASADFRLVSYRSRFEVDLNRPREKAVYRTAEDAWGLQVWRSEPPPDLIDRSLAIHDQFYAALAAHLDQLAATGPFVVFDVHSYNHRRGGPDAPPAPLLGNPDVNVGTGSMRPRWRPVVDALMGAFGRFDVGGSALDVRENVAFRGGDLARWVHTHYPSTGCALAIEFKKTFMDEWTGDVDEARLDQLASALRQAIPPVQDALRRAA